MMDYYNRIESCPNCKKDFSLAKLKNVKEVLGSPFQVCPYCNSPYFDPAYKEPAIAYYNKNRRISFGAKYCFAIAAAITIITAITGYICSLPFCYLSAGIALVITLILSLLLKFAKNDLRERETYLNGTAVTPEIKESLVRLADRDYLDKLEKHKIEVPEFFYQRIGASKMEEKDLKAAITEKETDEYAAVLDAYRRSESAKKMLALGIKSREFRNLADESKMTPDELMEYCKKTITEFDDKVEYYNASHASPFEYPSDY